MKPSVIQPFSYSSFQRLDRQWYGNDEGYDDTNNPFANVPEEYMQKREKEMANKVNKRMSFQQRQINKVCIVMSKGKCFCFSQNM